MIFSILSAPGLVWRATNFFKGPHIFSNDPTTLSDFAFQLICLDWVLINVAKRTTTGLLHEICKTQPVCTFSDFNYTNCTWLTIVWTCSVRFEQLLFCKAHHVSSQKAVCKVFSLCFNINVSIQKISLDHLERMKVLHFLTFSNQLTEILLSHSILWALSGARSWII